MSGIDWSGCSIVEVNAEKLGGVPTVRDWRLSADAVVENFEDGVTEEEIADMFDVPLEDVHTILSYAEQVRHSAHSL